MPRLLLPLLMLVALAVGAAACGDDREENAGGTPETEQEAAGTSEREQTSGCEDVAEPEPKGEQNRRKPKLELDADTTYVATVLTNCGEFEITLDAENAPKTGGSFVELARDGFYDGLPFHRVVEGFVVQGGDPLGTGEGGPGYSIVEAPPEDIAYTKGVVAMAKTAVEDPGTSGSQFFVVTGEDAGLDPDYALLGKVTKGQDVVDRIGVVPVGEGDRPVEPVVMRQVKVEER